MRQQRIQRYQQRKLLNVKRFDLGQRIIVAGDAVGHHLRRQRKGKVANDRAQGMLLPVIDAKRGATVSLKPHQIGQTATADI